MEEKILYTGSPSQIVNLGYYLLCLLLLPLAGIGLIMFLIRFFQTKYTSVEVNSERLVERSGVFSRKTDEMELYRVKDIRHEEPFFLRLFQLSNIILYTSDKSTPIITLHAVEQGDTLRRIIREAVEARRTAKGVKETDME